MGMPLRDAPIGAAHRSVTVVPERTVLVVVHDATTPDRLRDAIGLFDADPRVQLVATSCGKAGKAGGDVEAGGDGKAVGDVGDVGGLGLVGLAWQQAARTRFDLIVTAGDHASLTELHGPVALLPHGVGHPPAARPDTAGPPPERLLHNGQPTADTLVARQERPAPLPGDPCYDRMLASRPERRRYRAALGVEHDRTLVVVSSTWGTGSLLGSSPRLPRRLVGELPVDTYQVAAVLHPTVWRGHGPGQVRAWLADCVRAGLILIPPGEDWRAALLAADCVVGDHGSVATYGAALGRPTLLAAFADSAVAPGTAVRLLGSVAPRLRPGPIRPQIEATIKDFQGYAEVASLVSAAPGESPPRLRRLFYDLMHLAEPPGEALLPALPADGLHPGARPAALWVTTSGDAPMHLERVPAFPEPEPDRGVGHLAVHCAHPSRQLRAAADVLFAYDCDVPTDPAGWLRALDAPFAAVAWPHGCLLRAGAELWELTGDIDATVLASAAYAWKGDLATGFDLAVNGRTHKVSAHRQSFG